jgi:rRNA-processing protein EBP2
MQERQDGNTLTTEDDFDVELEAAQERGGKQPKMTREKRNDRYGFGGSKRKVKRNDDDVGDLSSFDKRGRGGAHARGRGGNRRGGPQRPGKQRRLQHKR